VLPAIALLLANYIHSTYVFSGLDLGDLPGPGGVKIITALVTGDLDRDWATWTIASSLPLFDQDALAASRFWMRLGGLMTVLGAFLCGHALAGARVALCAGLVAACWSQPLYIQQLIGADSIALGMCWLGVGLSWSAGVVARREDRWCWSGIPLALVGVALAAFAVAVKVVALPAAVLVALAPFLVWEKDKPWKGVAIRAAAVAGVIGIAWFAARSSFLPAQSGHVQDTPPVGPATLQAGWERLMALPKTQPETGVLISLMQLSWMGALIPGRGWLWRIGLGLAGTAALAYSAETIGDKIHVRTLTTAALPIVVLCGSLLGLATYWLQLGCKKLMERLSPASSSALQPRSPLRLAGAALPWLLPAAVSMMLLFDGLAFMHAWGGLRAQHAGAAAVDLPRAPLSWESRYSRMGGVTFEDTTAYGSVSLSRLAREAPTSGVAGVPLRDARDFHMRAAAALAGKSFVILEPQRCCSDKQPSAQCAESVIDQLDRIGARLILPRTDTGPANRYGQREWTQKLETALSSREGVESVDNMWWVWNGEGTEGPLPCCGGGESCYAPGQIKGPPPGTGPAP
jgi:hypothetical protein